VCPIKIDDILNLTACSRIILIYLVKVAWNVAATWVLHLFKWGHKVIRGIILNRGACKKGARMKMVVPM
jgi:hypothetical protein